MKKGERGRREKEEKRNKKRRKRKTEQQTEKREKEESNQEEGRGKGLWETKHSEEVEKNLRRTEPHYEKIRK